MKLFKALENVSNAVGYSDDEDYSIVGFIAVVLFGSLIFCSILWPLDGVIR